MRKLVAGLLFAVLVAALAAPPAVARTDRQRPKSRLDKLVKLKNIREHQRNLFTIAEFNGGTRAAGTDGYAISVMYVVDQLRRAGYQPTVQELTFDFWGETGPSTLAREGRTYEAGTDYVLLEFSGSGDVTAPVTPVDVDSADSGCEPEDFTGFPAGSIALIKRGSCTFALKTTNAQAAGAPAVVIFNDGANEDRQGPIAGGTLVTPFDLPVLGPSFAVGTELVGLASQGLRLHINTQTINEQRPTWNVLAETRRGRADNVVVVGAHLDSVPAGAGINDNASGSAVVLEIAKQIPKLRNRIRNKVRFAFFGAEELGLVGSEFYVSQLSQAERDDIALNLNFDMLGSPNFVRFVYDGDDSLGIGSNPPPGSAAIEKTLVDYLARRGLASEPTPFNGRSDYGPFIAVGIPAGGLFSGAEGIKTPEQVEVYGGTAGIQYDPCYHEACDTEDNVARNGYNQLADAAAFGVERFAWSTLPVNGVARGRTATTTAPTFDYKGHNLIR